MTSHYAFWVKLAAWAASFTALLLVVVKLYGWWISDASVMLASATDSLLDLFISTINLVILRVALSPADKEHTFGHGKAESLAGLLQAAFITGSALLLLANGIQQTVAPVIIKHSGLMVTITIFSTLLTLALVFLQTRVIKKTGSVAITADALHYKGDLLLNLGVLLALLLSEYFSSVIDGIATCVIALYLLLNGVLIVRKSLEQLMDKALPEQKLQIITAIITAHQGVKGFHQLRTRQSGHCVFIQFHLELNQNLALFDAHRIGDEVEQALFAEFDNAEVLIHFDPVNSD